MNKKRIGDDLQVRCLETRLTKLEASLIAQLRKLDFGQLSLVIHKIEGQPIRIEIASINSSKILDVRDGLNLEDTVYVTNFTDKKNDKY